MVEIWGNRVRLVGYKSLPSKRRKLPRTASGRLPIDHTKVDEGDFWEDVFEREEQRFENNICRAKKSVRELAMCNKWDYFCTFTLDESKQNRYDLKGWKKDLGNWIGNFNRKFDANLVYLFIPEQHSNGAWHGHGLLSGIPEKALVRNEFGYLDFPYYRNRFGYISLSPVRSPERVANYVSKYITKSANGTARELEKGARLYLSSRGLSKSRKIGLVEVSDFRADWENDFVSITERDGSEALDVIRFLNQCGLQNGLDNEIVVRELTILGKENDAK